MTSIRSVLLPAAMVAAFLCASGCSTISRWRQEHREAVLHRKEVDEAAAAHANPPAYKEMKRKMAQHDAQLRSLQTALANRGDADSLAASALVNRAYLGYSSGDALGLATRAVTAAPARIDLAFVQLQLCETDPQCDPVPLEAHLLQLDPQNGVPWTYALMRADHGKDQNARATAFFALARSRRIDLYWSQVVSHVTAAATGTAGFDASAALTQAIGIEATFAIAFEPITRLCLAQNLQVEMLDPCRKISASFRQGDTAVVEAYGSSLALHLWPVGSLERAEVLAERRLLRYRVDLNDRNKIRLNSPQASRTLAGLVGHYPSEQTTYHAFYLKLGLNPDPPDDWKDPAPGG